MYVVYQGFVILAGLNPSGSNIEERIWVWTFLKDLNNLEGPLSVGICKRGQRRFTKILTLFTSYLHGLTEEGLIKVRDSQFRTNGIRTWKAGDYKLCSELKRRFWRHCVRTCTLQHLDKWCFCMFVKVTSRMHDWSINTIVYKRNFWQKAFKDTRKFTSIDLATRTHRNCVSWICI